MESKARIFFVVQMTIVSIGKGLVLEGGSTIKTEDIHRFQVGGGLQDVFSYSFLFVPSKS